MFLGSVFLPESYIVPVFAHLLENAPFSGDSIDKFVGYLRSYWQPKLSKISVWDGNFPRTSNVAEGYHNGMQTSFQK